MVKIKSHLKFDGIYVIQSGDRKTYLTQNMIPGYAVYGEKLISDRGIEYREWNPYRSKLAAAITKNIRNIYLKKNSNCLYLGASSGTTVSHVSDIATEGKVFSVEFAPRSMRELVQHCENRPNVIPILADANFPERYGKFIYDEVDIVYEDIAQPNQTDIGILNCQRFLKNGGIFVITIKARSINVIANPKEVFAKELKKLEDAGFDVLEKTGISPYTQDHMVVVARYFEDE